LPDRLVTVRVFGNSADAHIAKMLLAENGIESVVTGENLLMIIPKAGLPRVELQVMADRVEEANRILNSQNKEES
jgi:hypothetical protein